MLSLELSELLARDLTRLVQELRAFPDTDSLWRTAPGITNAAGTLALHLEGNLREFVGRQIGHIPYTRDRAAEFSTRNVPQEDLVARAEALRDTIPPVVAGTTPAVLDAPYPQEVFGRSMSTRLFLIHLQAHLNYHLGQMDYLRRITTGAGAIPLAGMETQRSAAPARS